MYAKKTVLIYEVRQLLAVAAPELAVSGPPAIDDQAAGGQPKIFRFILMNRCPELGGRG